MNLLSRLQSVGEFDSRGYFTVDEAKAREKLGRFQLTDPSRFLLELVAASHQIGAAGMSVRRASGGTLIVGWTGGVALDEGLPHGLSDHLLDSSSRWQRLAVALNAASSYPGIAIQMRGGDHTYDWDQDSPPWPPSTRLQSLYLSNLSPEVQSTILSLFERETAWSDLPIEFEGSVRPRRLPLCFRGWCEREHLGQSLKMGLSDSLLDRALIIVQDGLAYPIKKLKLPLPLQAVLYSDGRYALDASYAEVIQNQDLDLALSAVANLGWEVAEVTLRQPQVIADLASPQSPLCRFCLELLSAENLKRIPVLGELPLFQVRSTEFMSVSELMAQAPGSVAYCRDASILCPDDMLVARVSDASSWNAFQALFKDRFHTDATPLLKKRQDFERSRQRFFQSPRKEAVLPGPLLVQARVEGAGFAGQIGLSSSTRSSQLRVLLQGRELTLQEVDSPYPFLAVVDFEQLDVNEDWSGVAGGEAYGRALDVLRSSAQALNRELASPDGPLARQARDFIVQLLLSKNRALPIFRNTPLLNTLDGQLWSLQQVAESLGEGLSLGYVKPDCKLSVPIPQGCWPCEGILVLSREELRLLQSLFPKEWNKIKHQGEAVGRESARFSSLRTASLIPSADGLRRTLTRTKGEIELVPRPGSLEVEILKNGVYINKRILSSILVHGRAVVDLSAVVPTPNWRDFSSQDPAWLVAVDELKEAEKELLSASLGQLFVKDWRLMVQALALQGFEGAERARAFEAFPENVSLQQLQQSSVVNYGELPRGVDMSQLEIPFVLQVDPETRAHLQNKLPSLEWKDAGGALAQLKHRQDFLSRPQTALTFSRVLRKAVLPQPLHGEVALGPALDGSITWHHQDRRVETTTGLPLGLAALVQSSALRVTDNYERMRRESPWEEHVEQVRQAAFDLLRQTFAEGLLTGEPSRLPTLEMALDWLRNGPLELRPEILRLKVVPILGGTCTMEKYIAEGQLDGGKYVFLDTVADAGLVLKDRDPATLPLVLDLSRAGPVRDSSLQSWLGQTPKRAQEYLKRERLNWEKGETLRSWQKSFPKCWADVQVDDSTRFGVPADGAHSVYYIVDSGVAQKTPPYPVVGYSQSDLSAQELSEGAGQAYLALVKGGPLDQRRRTALVAYLTEYLFRSRSAGQNPPALQALLEEPWFPVQGGARASLTQLLEWSQLEEVGKSMPYLDSPGLPQNSYSFPVPVVTTLEELKFLKSHLRMGLKPVERRSWWRSVQNSTMLQIPAQAWSQINKVGQTFIQRVLTLGELSKEEKEAKLARERQERRERLAAEVATARPDEEQRDPETELLKALRREANLLAPASARRALLNQLEHLEFGRYLFGPVTWRDDKGNWFLNRTHACVRKVMQRREADPASVLHLLIYLVAEINRFLEKVTDEEELAFLGILEENLLKSYPEGCNRVDKGPQDS